MTKTEQLARGLERLGWKETTSASHKYRRFEHVTTEPREGRTIWLGKSGALRVGPRSSDSTSLTGGATYDKILKAGASE